MKTPGQIFGELIRAERKRRGYTLQAFARTVDLSVAFISQIERGQMSPPSEGKIIKIAEVLELNPDELLVNLGRVPSDIYELILKNPQLISELRGRFLFF